MTIEPRPTRRLRILDATLRDGDQAAGFAFSVRAKQDIARALSASGVDIVEAGFPLSSVADGEACALIAEEFAGSSNAPLISLMCRAIPEDIQKTARFFGTNTRGIIHLSLPVSDLHLHTKLGMDRSSLLKRALQAVRIARTLACEVEMGAEDATRADRDFLVEYCDAVTSMGVRTVNIADTVGHALPNEFSDLISYLLLKVPAFHEGTSIISVHCHNDLSLAVANTLSAIGAGCGQIEVCALGLGERAGNASLEEIAAVLDTRSEMYNVRTGLVLSKLGDLTRLVSCCAGTGLSPLKPITGSNIRAHASGIHQHGISRNKITYRSFDAVLFDTVPERIVLSRHSGRSGVEMAARMYAGIHLISAQATHILDRIKASLQDDSPVFGITEFLLLLKDEGLVATTVFSCRDVVLSADGERSVLSATFFRNDHSGIHVINETGYGSAPFDAALDLIRRLFITDIFLRSVSISGYGNGTAFRWRVYIEAFCIAFERIGTDQNRLMLEVLLDAINCRQNMH